MNKALFYCVMLLLMACETDSYEKGQGRYSLMQADLSELAVDAEKRAVAFTTDDGDAYRIANPFTAQWISTPDTTYRMAIYYNKVEGQQAEVVGVNAVSTLKPREHWRVREQPDDPVGIESAWIAKNGKYINLGLMFKSGRIEDEEGPHVIGIVQDTVLVNTDQTRTAYYRLLHDQGDTPEFYTTRHYVSILLPEERPDSVRLSMNTYQGVIERLFPL